MKIVLNGQKIVAQQDGTILDAIIAATPDNQVLIDYQCRDGYCGSCRCKLLSGKVGYIKPTLAYLAQDEILPCSAIALTDLELTSK